MAETFRVVINTCFGGFGLSKEARELYKKKGGENTNIKYNFQLGRSDPILADVVTELGKKANSNYAKLEVVTLPLILKRVL